MSQSDFEIKYIFFLIFSYEERARSLETVVTKHKKHTTYEEFISKVYTPVLSPSSFSGISTTNNNDGTSSSTLAAALLDSHGHIPKGSQRADQKYRGN